MSTKARYSAYMRPRIRFLDELSAPAQSLLVELQDAEKPTKITPSILMAAKELEVAGRAYLFTGVFTDTEYVRIVQSNAACRQGNSTSAVTGKL